MRRIITSVMALLGLTGSAKVARHIGQIEKTVLKLNDAVDQINSEIYDADIQHVAAQTAWKEKEAAHAFEQSQRIGDRARAQRVAFRLIGLVS